MRRIHPLAFLLAFAAGLPFIAEAQQPARMARIGLLSPDALPGERDTIVLRRLSELGWIEGRNLVVERRSAEQKPERLRALAHELVQIKVDLIVAITTPAVDAARKATTRIPIVMAPAGDALGSGFVTNLARPAGNITGVTFTHEAVGPKRLELLKDLIPGLDRVAILGWQQNRILHDPMWKAAERAARPLKLSAKFFEVRHADEIEDAFVAMAQQRMRAVVVLPGPLFAAERQRIADTAAKLHLVSMCDRSEYVDAGCLLSYGANLGGIQERAAIQIDRILNGAKPGDLPVEQPTQFELVINLKTAKAIGLTVPQPVLMRADRLIE